MGRDQGREYFQSSHAAREPDSAQKVVSVITWNDDVSKGRQWLCARKCFVFLGNYRAYGARSCGPNC